MGLNIGAGFTSDLSAEEMIGRAKYDLRLEAPFFAYIIDNLIVRRNDKLVPTMGVDKYGRLYYNEKFLCGQKKKGSDKKDGGLTHAELCGVMIHEGMHVALKHVTRSPRKTKEFYDHRIWNWAIDIVDNYIVLASGFQLPAGGIAPKMDGSGKPEDFIVIPLNIELPNGETVTLKEIRIDDIPNKCAEQIYEELIAEIPWSELPKKGKSKVGEGGDSHIEAGEGEGGEGETTEEMKGIEGKDWGKILAEAEAYAKSQGKMPAGIGREMGELRRSRIPWRSILRKEVASTVPYDLTYSRPNRNFIPLGIYMPSSYGERVSVIVSLDTSGSMSAEEMAHAISEVIGIATAYPGTDFRILTWDAEVHDDILIRSSSIHQIKALRPKGGGGSV